MPGRTLRTHFRRSCGRGVFEQTSFEDTSRADHAEEMLLDIASPCEHIQHANVPARSDRSATNATRTRSNWGTGPETIKTGATLGANRGTTAMCAPPRRPSEETAPVTGWSWLRRFLCYSLCRVGPYLGPSCGSLAPLRACPMFTHVEFGIYVGQGGPAMPPGRISESPLPLRGLLGRLAGSYPKQGRRRVLGDGLASARHIASHDALPCRVVSQCNSPTDPTVAPHSNAGGTRTASRRRSRTASASLARAPA